VDVSKSVVKTKGITVEYKHLALRKLKSIQKKRLFLIQNKVLLG